MTNPSQFSIYSETVEWLKKTGVSVEHKSEMLSTNDRAKAAAFSEDQSLLVYIADQQSQGRGRNTNSWKNPAAGHSLLATFSFSLEEAPQPIVTALAGLRVFQALSSNFKDLSFSLKAPNDVLLNGKKIAGLLLETVQMGDRFQLLIGLGLNIWSHPLSIENATHLASQTPLSKNDWQNFLKDLLGGLKSVALESHRAALSPRERDDLIHALNANPHLSERALSLSPFADIVFENQTVSWRAL